MKYITGIAALLLAVASPQVLAAPASCERVKSDIEQRIINNGVAESSFTLNIVPNDQADQPDSLVVGHCANDTHKILYTRTNSGNAPANSTLPRRARRRTAINHALRARRVTPV